MKKIFGTALISGFFAMLATGCTVNQFTMGKNNMKGIKLAVKCKNTEALTEIEKDLKSEMGEYRRTSYLLQSALWQDSGDEEKVKLVLENFTNDDVIEQADKDKDEFIEDARCLKEYIQEKRIKKNISESGMCA